MGHPRSSLAQRFCLRRSHVRLVARSRLGHSRSSLAQRFCLRRSHVRLVARSHLGHPRSSLKDFAARPRFGSSLALGARARTLAPRSKISRHGHGSARCSHWGRAHARSLLAQRFRGTATVWLVARTGGARTHARSSLKDFAARPRFGSSLALGARALTLAPRSMFSRRGHGLVRRSHSTYVATPL